MLTVVNEVKVDMQSTEPTKHEANYEAGEGEGEEEGEGFSTTLGMAATACNEAKVCWVDLVHQNLIIFNCWWNIYDIMQYMMDPDKSSSEGKPGMMSQTRSAKSQKFSFSSAEPRMVVHTAGLPKFPFWKSLFICSWLQWYLYRISRPSTCSYSSAKLVVIPDL